MRTSENPRLRNLEAESIEILREAASSPDLGVILYSVGKDSSVLLHLAGKAFAPGSVPFPILHVDTGFKFPEMYEFRDRRARELGYELLVESNSEAIRAGANPFDLGTPACCGLLKTDALLKAVGKHGFRLAIGGARRDEEKSRAKERVFSIRQANGGWDPKAQRIELWNHYNTRLADGQSMRVFPLSNWTEIDIWKYIALEKIETVSLYYAKPRTVVRRNGQLIPFREGMKLRAGEITEDVMCRFRTLGCSPCTGAIESQARTLPDLIQELETIELSERSTRVIDHDESSSMEKKKREGYF